MTIRQAAERLETSRSLLYTLCKLGAIWLSRIGRPGKRGSIRISEDALIEYLRAREVGPAVVRPTPSPRPRIKLQHLQGSGGSEIHSKKEGPAW